MRAWLYAVVSSSKQEDTIDDQEAWGRATAAEHGWDIERVFRGVSSGAQGTRKLLEDLLAELRKTSKHDRPERVLMIRIDRLGRGDGLEAIAAISEIKRLGITLHTRQDGDVKIDRATDALIPALRSITGALENEARSEKSRALHARKRAAGEVQGPVPYGFTVDNARAVPMEPEASFVRDLFERRATGWGILRLAKYARTHAPGKQMKWPGSSIRTVLSNQRYRGTIVSEDLYDEVSSIRGERPPANQGPFLWPLRGAVKCVCGLRLVTRPSGRKGHYTRYYFCYNTAAHGRNIGHRANDLESQFVHILGELEANPSVVVFGEGPTDDTDARLKELSARRGDLTKQRERIWEMFNRDVVSEAELGKRLSQIADEERRHDEMVADVERAARVAAIRRRRVMTIREEMSGLAEGWTSASVEIQQQIARTVAEMVEGLWVDPSTPHKLWYGAR